MAKAVFHLAGANLLLLLVKNIRPPLRNYNEFLGMERFVGLT